jgi:hypothetical protein
MPDAIARETEKRSDAAWEYWREVIPHAVTFAVACLRPEDDETAQQRKLAATIDTIVRKLRED